MIQARLQETGLEETSGGSIRSAGAHLDEDALSAFVEGCLGERESAPLIKHLIACGFCRRITAQLVRLDQELSALEEPAARPRLEDEAGRLRRFLADLAARVIPSSDADAVFAYHAPAEDFQRATDAEPHSETDERSEPEADAPPEV